MVVLVLAGCTGQDDGAAGPPRLLQGGPPGEASRELTPEELADAEAQLAEQSAPTDADVAFVQGMILHHVQALRMTRLVPDRTSRDDVPLFAERIDVSQEDELDLMRNWLEERGEASPGLLGDHDHGDDHVGADDELMPGMLTEQELLELESASGETFDRLFLEAMIHHHLGALVMVDDLIDAGGGQEPELARFVNHVYSDQSIEISRAEAMLAELDAPSS